MKRFILSLLLIYSISHALTIGEIKKLHYAEQTKENVALYKNSLEELSSQNNIEAILMLAQAYESGTHWEVDTVKSLQYYKKAAELGSGKAFLKIGILFYNQEESEKAKRFLTSALQLNQTEAISYLLDIAILQKDNEQIEYFLNLAKTNNIKIDETAYKDADIATNSKSETMKYIEDKTFEITKNYIVGVLQTISSLQGAFDNLGYEVDEYIVHNSIEPTIEIILKKVHNLKPDEEMAMLIAGDNILKISIIKSLIWANAMEPFMAKEAGHTLKGIELEIGSNVAAKIVTQKSSL